MAKKAPDKPKPKPAPPPPPPRPSAAPPAAHAAPSRAAPAKPAAKPAPARAPARAPVARAVATRAVAPKPAPKKAEPKPTPGKKVSKAATTKPKPKDDSTPAKTGDGKLTIYGSDLTDENVSIIQAAIRQGDKAGANELAQKAALYAAAGESTMSAEVGNGGPWQTTCNMSAYDSGRDIDAQAYAWYTGGECFSSGGGIYYSSQYDTVWQVANATEENAVWGASKQDSYARGGYSTDDLTNEIEAIYAHYKTSGASSPAAAPPVTTSSVSGGGGTDLSGSIKGLNWAGDLINSYKYMVGGADSAAHMADEMKARIGQIDSVAAKG